MFVFPIKKWLGWFSARATYRCFFLHLTLVVLLLWYSTYSLKHLSILKVEVVNSRFDVAALQWLLHINKTSLFI